MFYLIQNGVIAYIEKQIKKKTYCLINVISHSKMYERIIQFLKIIENNTGKSLQNALVSPTISNINKLINCINNVRKLFDEFKIKKVILFKIMYNKKTNNIVGILGFFVKNESWLFLDIELIYLIVNTSLFKYLEKGNK